MITCTPTDWPEFGATVRVTLYVDGTHDTPSFAAIGAVVATPLSGHEALVIHTGPIPGGEAADEAGRWVIGAEHVTILPQGRSQWSVETALAAEQPLLLAATVNPTMIDTGKLAYALHQALKEMGLSPKVHIYSPYHVTRSKPLTEAEAEAAAESVPALTVINLST